MKTAVKYYVLENGFPKEVELMVYEKWWEENARKYTLPPKKVMSDYFTASGGFIGDGSAFKENYMPYYLVVTGPDAENETVDLDGDDLFYLFETWEEMKKMYDELNDETIGF